MEQPASNGPPIGKWRDGICDCLTNLWPSCGCALFPYGIWIMSQSKFYQLLKKIYHMILTYICYY